MLFRTQAHQPLQGELTVPGDKSISHRALMLGGLAQGTTTISHLLLADDVLATATAMAQLGVVVEKLPGRWRVHGLGAEVLTGSNTDIDLGNSGTGIRLLAGLLAGQGIGAVLTGDHSLRSRPMNRILTPLRQMGAEISAVDERAPLHIKAGLPLAAIDYNMPMASAQVKSCILLAALGARGITTVTEPAATRDYTESMLRAYGVEVDSAGLSISLRGPQTLTGPVNIEVPGDISSAAFFLVAATLVPGSELLLRRVGVNPLRTGLLDVLRIMGADITLENERLAAGERLADLRVRHAPLRGCVVDPAVVPRMIDEFPVLFLAAALAEGETIVSGAAELRVKESDRIAVMATGLKVLGADIEVTEDGAVIRGVEGLSGGTTDGALDHRCAMTLALAGLRSDEPVTVAGADNVSTSYPEFVEHLSAVGGQIEVHHAG